LANSRVVLLKVRQSVKSGKALPVGFVLLLYMKNRLMWSCNVCAKVGELFELSLCLLLSSLYSM